MNAKLIWKAAVCMAVFFFIAAAQAQNDAKIRAIADDACGCTKNISAEIPRDSIIAHINNV